MFSSAVSVDVDGFQILKKQAPKPKKIRTENEINLNKVEFNLYPTSSTVLGLFSVAYFSLDRGIRKVQGSTD